MPFGLGFFATAGAGAAGSFDLLETQVLTGTQASITFSSLSTYASTYKHLQIRAVVRFANAAASDTLSLRMNSDSGSNYAQHGLYGNGSVVGSFAGTPRTSAYLTEMPAANDTANKFGASVADLLDAFDTNKTKTMRAFSGFATGQVSLQSSVWLNTNAISSLTLFCTNGSNFASNTRISLYGIKGA